MALQTPPPSMTTSDAPADALLLRRYAATRDARDRDRLVRRYLPLARYAANRYARKSEPFDDLLQVASLGLLKAIDRYDPLNGASFCSYALPTMLGELRRHFRDHGWTVRPPRTLLEHALVVERATTELAASGRSPTVPELARETGLTDEEILDAREASVARSGTSLALRVGGQDERGDAVELGELLGTVDDGFAQAEDRATVASLVASLTRREREILRLRMEEDLTQREIGERVGLSQMHVSRILRDILGKLHRAAADRAATALPS
jgi:RNA polymerase sigma-B factor